jgi:hypothetical protein
MTFEDLESGRQARQLTRDVYALTRQDQIFSAFQRVSLSAFARTAKPRCLFGKP